MFKRYLILLCLAVSMSLSAASQGTTCGTAIPLALDGVLRAYPTSTTLGLNVLCTNSGTTPVTWFRFTSNAAGQCPLLNISVSDNSACEVAFYTSCATLLSSSSMCFYQGNGLWAPNENFVINPNTTYYLRVKTTTACFIRIAGQHYLPANDDCLGAMSLSNVNISDNNACDHAGPGVMPSQLCALTLENTAWYQFYIQSTGYGVINITNIQCNNGATNNSSGFQIGFFQGSCTNLQWLTCTNGSGATIQATTPQLEAGTRVYVAIDGISGSNCSYQINGMNIIGVLAGNIKHFSGWKTERTNLLKWTILQESGGYYIMERSVDGIDFSPIGTINSRSSSNGTETYSFEDSAPFIESYYRIRQFDRAGRQALSNTVYLQRKPGGEISIMINNPVSHVLQVKTTVERPGNYHFRLINLQGQLLRSFDQDLYKGANQLNIETSALPKGQYAVVVSNGSARAIRMFTRQ